MTISAHSGLTSFNSFDISVSYREAWAKRVIQSVWNSKYIRQKTGDAIVLNLGAEFVSLAGFNWTGTFIMPIRGPQRFHGYVTETKTFSGGVAAGVFASIGKAYYNGQTSEIDVIGMEGLGYSAGGGAVVNGEIWYSMAGSHVIWSGINIGLGIGLPGGSVGQSYTSKLHKL